MAVTAFFGVLRWRIFSWRVRSRQRVLSADPFMEGGENPTERHGLPPEKGSHFCEKSSLENLTRHAGSHF